MAEYRILVADDKLHDVEKSYERLFSGDPLFLGSQQKAGAPMQSS